LNQVPSVRHESEILRSVLLWIILYNVDSLGFGGVVNWLRVQFIEM
jgi:hypothetical protein